MRHVKGRTVVLGALLLLSLGTVPVSVMAHHDEFSRKRLERLDDLARRVVAAGQYPGVLMLVARHGKVIHLTAVGKQGLAGSAALDESTIFRIFSMTKPVTAVAMMILYEEGRWSPQDPISRFIPQFTGLEGYTGRDATGKMLLATPDHPPTMGELMTMTAGFTYGADATPVDEFYFDARGRHVFRATLCRPWSLSSRKHRCCTNPAAVGNTVCRRISRDTSLRSCPE